MTGDELVKLMRDSWLCAEIAKHARRYSKRVEDQEEYIQDAWIRIAKDHAGKQLDAYGEEARRAINASYARRRYHVEKKKAGNLNGISVTGKEIKRKPPPKRAIDLGRGRYLDPKHETLDWEYYKGQKNDIRIGAIGQMKWYKRYPGFESLTRHEQEKVIHRFMNSGYKVGMPIGATNGKTSKHYKILLDYCVDASGLVTASTGHGGREIDARWRTPAGGPCEQIDLRYWYELRDMGGPKKWTDWLDAAIAELELL